jgi:plasmid stability protein
MPDLLLRNVDPELKRRIAEQARENGRSLSEEAQALIMRGLPVRPTRDASMSLGAWLFALVPPEARGDDLVFERRDDAARPPPDLA